MLMTAAGSITPGVTAVLATALVGVGAPTWNSIVMLGVLAGLLSLDDTALLQSWISQPLPAGVLTGALCGDPVTGLAIGLPVQLVLAGNLPVGQSFTGDTVTAMVAAVGAIVTSGYGLTPVLTTVGLEQLALVGWMVVAVGLFSGAGHLMIQMERRAHFLWMLEGHRTLRDGRLGRIEKIHARCLLTTFLRGLVTTIILLLFLRRLWLPGFAELPQPLIRALAMLPLLLPGLGLGNLIERFGLRTSWIWVVAGTLFSFLATRFVL